jgi:hypothetical protein
VFKVSCSSALTALLAISAVAQTNPDSARQGTGPSSFIGCVQKSGDVYTLTDETSKTTVQLRGGNLKKGRHVEVTGTASAIGNKAGGAAQVVDVSSVKSVTGSCQAASAGSPGRAFMSRGTVASIGIVAGVAVVALVATVSRLGEARGGK